MRGSIRQRYKGSYSLILDLGYVTDPATGKRKRRQQWITFRGSRRAAENKLSDLLHEANHGEYISKSKTTLGEWVSDWLEKAIKPPKRRQHTYDRYKGILDNHLKASWLAQLPIQKAQALDLERYYAELKQSPATVAIHHALLHGALRAAARARLVRVNVATDVEGKPKGKSEHEDARLHCWTAEEARAFLAAAKAAGDQPGAFYALALDTGARKAELCGLRWSNVDLDAGKIAIVEQLDNCGSKPTFGPPKNGLPRTVSISDGTVRLLRAHKRSQSELKMANRKTYQDNGLVFAKDWSALRRDGETLGQPLPMNNLGQREYSRLIKAAGIRRIKFHGMRHTMATLLLKAGEPVHVVSERLGHKKVQITLDIYAHVLPDMQRQAATTLGDLLHR